MITNKHTIEQTKSISRLLILILLAFYQYTIRQGVLFFHHDTATKSTLHRPTTYPPKLPFLLPINNSNNNANTNSNGQSSSTNIDKKIKYKQGEVPWLIDIYERSKQPKSSQMQQEQQLYEESQLSSLSVYNTCT